MNARPQRRLPYSKHYSLSVCNMASHGSAEVADPQSLTLAYCDRHQLQGLLEVRPAGCVRLMQLIVCLPPSQGQRGRGRGQGGGRSFRLHGVQCAPKPATPATYAPPQLVLAELLVHKPEDPKAFIVAYLERTKARGTTHFLQQCGQGLLAGPPVPPWP